MTRSGKKLGSIRDFNDLPQIHYNNPVTYMADNGQIMGNNEIGKTQILLQFGQQIDDLGLNRNIKGGYNFIAHNQLWFQSQSTGDPDPLTLPTG